MRFHHYALRTEEAFEQLFALARQGKLVAFGLPGPLRAAVMAQEFEDEVRLAGLPPALQKFAASLLAPVGRLLGYGGRSL